MNLSLAIIHEARSWVGTKFHHQGRLKKSDLHPGGCDCLGLIIGVATKLKLISKQSKQLLLKDYDQTDYARLPDGKALYKQLSYHCQKIDLKQLQIGDILLFKFNDNPQHVALVSKYDNNNLTIIHAYIKAKKIIEHRVDEIWQSRIVSAFRFIELC